jgi:hypothetical protein
LNGLLVAWLVGSSDYFLFAWVLSEYLPIQLAGWLVVGSLFG